MVLRIDIPRLKDLAYSVEKVGHPWARLALHPIRSLTQLTHCSMPTARIVLGLEVLGCDFNSSAQSVTFAIVANIQCF